MPGTVALRRSRLAAVIALAAGFGLAAAGCGGDDADPGERDRAISAAMDAYADAGAKGIALDDGPCIAENLSGLDDWVVDIAHEPREDVDDLSENQCQRYRDGEASHFVELTPAGELIRAE